MSPPLPVTEDTPPDMLAGAMDLHVVLPNGQDMKMSVERSTPMMDLLVQVTTANKISPGGHVIQAIGDRGVLPYKPSTPIGALDTWTIHIVPKKKAGMILKKPFTKPIPNTPFEQTFRLQVNLPRNQLYVSRVSYRTRLEDVLNEVCKEKNLDQSKYCFTHPDNLEEELDLKKTFLDHKVQQLTLISKNNRPVGLSSSDVIALKRYDSRNQHVNNKYYASHSYDGSVSSGSMEGRSLSPVRSDESSSSPTIPKTNSILNRPFRKRRPAPKPPASQNGHEAKNVSESLTISHSRNSSDSSGYHESSVLSESPESNSNSLADSLPRRSKLPDKTPSNVKGQGPHMNGKIGASLSRSLSNLVAVGDSKSRTFLSNGIRHKEYSASSMSLASIGGKKKKAPAPPPPMSKSLLSLQEESSSTPATTLNGDFTSNSRNFASIPEDVVSKSQTLPATSNKLSTFSTAPPTSISTSTSSYASSNKTTTTTTQRTPTKPDLKPSPVAAARSVDKCSAVAVDEVDSGKITSLTKSSPTTTMVNGNTNAIIKPGNYDRIISSGKANDCTLRRSKQIRANCIPDKPSHLSLPENNLNLEVSSDSVDNSDIENVTPMKTTPIRVQVKGQDDDFRFNTIHRAYSPCQVPDDEDEFTMSKAYVNRRRSEIEARIASMEIPPSYRKYSEGTLPFSKLPISFVFPNDGRHLIFDSKRSKECPCGVDYDECSPTPPRRRSRDQSQGVNDQFLNNLNALLTRKL